MSVGAASSVSYGTPGRKASRRARRSVVWLGALLTFGLGVFIFSNAVSAYRPYTLLEYAAVETTYCPEEEVKSRYAATAIRPPLGSIGVITNRWEWVSTNGKTRIPGEPFVDQFNGAYGARSGVSPRIRFAPPDPGRWHLEYDLLVNGYQLLRPATQTALDLTTPPITVLEPTAPRCLRLADGG